MVSCNSRVSFYHLLCKCITLIYHGTGVRLAKLECHLDADQSEGGEIYQGEQMWYCRWKNTSIGDRKPLKAHTHAYVVVMPVDTQ